MSVTATVVNPQNVKNNDDIAAVVICYSISVSPTILISCKLLRSFSQTNFISKLLAFSKWLFFTELTD